jgi:hypothetical protein
MTLPGAPPPRAGAPPEPITSPHGGGSLDLLRTAILALQHYAEQETTITSSRLSTS